MTEYLSSCLHTLLVIGLPASGKLRARKRLKELNDPVRFHISDTIVQLNDSPYILLMRWIDKVLVKMGLEPVFFRGPGENFQDPRSWEALIHLLNQDYANLLAGTHLDLEAFEDSATVYMLHRLEQAHNKVLAPEMLTNEDADLAIATLGGRAYWTYEEEVVGAGGHYLQNGADGVIGIMAFGCGPDSLMMHVVHRQAARMKATPFMCLTLEEHTAEAGVVTRLEAFTDMLYRRKRGKAEVCV